MPHLALGAELSDDYRERTVVMAYNAILGMVGGSTAFFFCWSWLGAAEGGVSNRGNFVPIGAVIGIFATVVVWMSAWFTRDQIPRLKHPGSDPPPFSARQFVGEITQCFGNRNYLWLLLGMLCIAATNGVRDTIGAYVNLFFWELEPNQVRFFGLSTPLAFIVAFIVTPRLHARFDKRETMLWAAAVYVVATTLPIVLRILDLLPDNDHPVIFPMLLVFVSIYYGAGAILGISALSALADVADEHELATGRRQEGIFYSARSFVSKMTGAFGLFIAGVAIDVIGWPTGVQHSDPVDPGVVFDLGLIDGPISAIPALFAIWFYGMYDIDKRRHAETQRQLRARSAETEAGPSDGNAPERP